MPLEISEDIVSLAYQNLGYFVIEGRKVGRREIDLLAIHLDENGEVDDRLHIEVQVSTRPSGMLGGDDAAIGAKDYAQKKFWDRRVGAGARKGFGGKSYRKVFVHGTLKDKSGLQIKTLKRMHVECKHIGTLVRGATEKGRPKNALQRAMDIARFVHDAAERAKETKQQKE